MSCAQVRAQLAAYRRDDWSTGDLAALTAHISSCLDCRRLEATYRQTGERLRQLPSITPPPDFRERVFAAIRADQQRLDPAIARVALAVTNPSLPVVRPGARIARRRVQFQPKGALAIAAALGLALLGAGVLPHLGLTSFGGAAASLGHLRLNTTPATQAARYTVDASYGAPASAMATTAWLVYSAADAHGTMLFAEDRKTRRTLPLLSAATSAPITIRGVTNSWVVWSTGAGVSGSAWSVLASRLPDAGGASAPVTLVDSGLAGGDTLVTLGGVWVSGQTALISGATANGTGLLLRFDLSGATPQATIIARGATPGHLFTDPSSDHGAYYWADVWYDGASGLHGAIWKGNDAGQSSALSGDESSFHPTAAAGTLAWVEVAPDALASMTPGAQSASPDTDEQMLNQLAGTLYARNLTSGQQWQVSSRADVTSVRDSGTVVLWRSNSQTHAYDIQSKATSAAQAQVSGATMVTTSDTTMVWTQPGSSSLYVLDTGK